MRLPILVLLGVLAGCAVTPTRSDRPDIVLFIADDQTFSDCGCYGNPDVRTPNIDRLAKAGMKFDRMFTATAMCSPTRQQLYTGLFPVRNGAYPNHSKVKPGTKSIVHHLKKLGYRVGLAGKWHIGPPESFPFERLRGRDAEKELGLPFGEIREFISRDRGKPFCLIVASHEPHKPWNKGDPSAYPPAKLSIPSHLFDTKATREALSQYYAEITFMDQQLGRTMELVREHGDERNTAFLFTSEQGSQLPFGKWTCYELGLKTAFIVRWPARVKAGTETTAMTQYVDVVPTLIAAAGGALVDGFDGRSFLDLLEGRATTHHDYVFGIHTTRGIIKGSKCYPVRSIRSKRFKYIENFNADKEPFSNTMAAEGHTTPVLASWTEAGGRAAERARYYRFRPGEELYDLETDPLELDNLAARPELQKRLARLRTKLHAWMKQQGDEGIATEMLTKRHRRK